MRLERQKVIKRTNQNLLYVKIFRSAVVLPYFLSIFRTNLETTWLWSHDFENFEVNLKRTGIWIKGSLAAKNFFGLTCVFDRWLNRSASVSDWSKKDCLFSTKCWIVGGLAATKLATPDRNLPNSYKKIMLCFGPCLWVLFSFFWFKANVVVKLIFWGYRHFPHQRDVTAKI